MLWAGAGDGLWDDGRWRQAVSRYGCWWKLWWSRRTALDLQSNWGGGEQNRATLFLTQSVHARSTQPFGLARFSQQSFSSHSTPPSHSSAARCSSSSHCGCSFTPQTFSSTLARQLPLTPQFVRRISPGLACWQSIWFHLNCSIQIRTDLCLHGHAASNSPWNHNMLLLFPALAAGWWTHAGMHESTVCLLDDVAQSYAR